MLQRQLSTVGTVELIINALRGAGVTRVRVDSDQQTNTFRAVCAVNTTLNTAQAAFTSLRRQLEAVGIRGWSMIAPDENAKPDLDVEVQVIIPINVNRRFRIDSQMVWGQGSYARSKQRANERAIVPVSIVVHKVNEGRFL